MKTIKIPRATWKFLRELTKEIETQDNRITATPCGYMIREEVIFKDEDGCEFEYLDYDCIEVLTKDQIRDELIDVCCDEKEEVKKLFSVNSVDDVDCDNIDSIDKYARSEGYKKNWFSREHRYSETDANFFLTEKAAKEHIAVNKHNLKKPQDYLVHLQRNPEMEKLLKAIFEICGKKEYIK